MKQILINPPIIPTQTAIELPIGKAPRIDEADGMRANFLQQLHDGLCARELDLPDRDGRAGKELGRLALEGMEGVEAEELLHQGEGVWIQVLFDTVGAEGVVEVFDHEVLRLGGAEAPEIDEEAVPRLLVFVAVFERFEGEEGGAPGEGGDEVGVGAEDVEGGAHVAAREEGVEDAGGVVGGGGAGEDGAGGFEELGWG